MQIFMGAPVFIDTASMDPLEIALEEMKLGGNTHHRETGNINR